MPDGDLGTLRIRLGGDTAEFDRILKKATGKLDTAAKKMRQIGKKMSLGS